MTHRPSAWGPLYPRYRKARKAVVDAAAWAVLSPLALRQRRARLPERPRSILVVALLKIGDTITTLPTVAALKRRFPEARIGLWVSPRAAPLARLAEGVDALFEGATRRTARRIRAEGFEAAVVCSFVPQHLAWARAACRGAVVGYAYRGRGLFCDVAVPAPPQVGLAVADYPPGLPILHQTEVVGLLARPFGIEGPLPPPRLAVPAGAPLPEGDGPRIALHIGNEQPHYRWPETRWADLARGLAGEARARLWITGGPGDAEAAARIKALAQRDAAVTVATGHPLPQTAALLAGMDLVVSVDTMATHLAAALGRPVVALFGPGAPKVWRPSGEGHVVLQNESVCHGCRQPRCHRPTHECMEGISVEAVLEAVRSRLDENAEPVSR